MSEQERNKEIVEKIYSICWNHGDMDMIDEIFDENVNHEQFLEGWPTGREGFKTLVRFWREAFPDIHEDAIELIAEGNKVASRFRLRGTHKGDFYGIPGTGKKIDIYGGEMFTFNDGKVVDYLYHEDALGLFFQIGVMPLNQDEIAGVDVSAD
ncbi:ester cyclase [Kordiimonas sp. SCSIO 12603]|uniref:ester cyclase n=1 Tax=Kordiimonas sp. SCSIO 12603 TaxID=2829596 RepID=UPI0021062D1A|nr:ester cyclase [Kordiimonas sp. SCSIO 12603]UTW60349.1 ester cyclase [Kordiimonas sp. SCSIO 12603]